MNDCTFRGGENCTGTLRPRLGFGTSSSRPASPTRHVVIIAAVVAELAQPERSEDYVRSLTDLPHLVWIESANNERLNMDPRRHSDRSPGPYVRRGAYVCLRRRSRWTWHSSSAWRFRRGRTIPARARCAVQRADRGRRNATLGPRSRSLAPSRCSESASAWRSTFLIRFSCPATP